MSYLEFGLFWLSLLFLPVTVMLLFFKSDTFSREAHIKKLKQDVEEGGKAVAYIAKRGSFPLALPALSVLIAVLFYICIKDFENINILALFFVFIGLSILSIGTICYLISIAFDVIILSSSRCVYVSSLKWCWKTKMIKISKDIKDPFIGPLKIDFLPINSTFQAIHTSENTIISIFSAEDAKILNKIYSEVNGECE